MEHAFFRGQRSGIEKKKFLLNFYKKHKIVSLKPQIHLTKLQMQKHYDRGENVYSCSDFSKAKELSIFFEA